MLSAAQRRCVCVGSALMSLSDLWEPSHFEIKIAWLIMTTKRKVFTVAFWSSPELSGIAHSVASDPSECVTRRPHANEGPLDYPPQSLDQHDKETVACGRRSGTWRDRQRPARPCTWMRRWLGRGVRSSEFTSSVFPWQAPRSRLLAAEEAFVMEILWMEFNPENNPEPGPPCSPTPPSVTPSFSLVLRQILGLPAVWKGEC